MRSTIAACAILVLLIGTADAEQCPPGALGVSRTLVVDPNEHSCVGSMQYPETLPLNDHEVVLTFDDGPLPRYTKRVLETLASECVKATFFMVGQMARAYPWMVRRVYDEGHTVARHAPPVSTSAATPVRFEPLVSACPRRQAGGRFRRGSTGPRTILLEGWIKLIWRSNTCEAQLDRQRRRDPLEFFGCSAVQWVIWVPNDCGSAQLESPLAERHSIMTSRPSE
jgi:hypothetical protein